ncbi:hypothetical protein [Mucilaginibacter sp. OK098]|uniref:hypothetical protein n=1 Tax=Mucilaginibacter sp. OK098 TaxID=1855297 RepID=UPI00091BA43E|nr:hypothetical protein [Mucilaginibacter sp. OK098]SHN25013.1 hypothetical protein SAMN05216524_107234 [Mucilaginibacter sp. OK098]
MSIIYKSFLNKLIAVAGLIAFMFTAASAQPAFDCAKLLSRAIAGDSAQIAVNNIKQHANCFGLDSVDVKIWAQAPVLGSLLVKRASMGNENLTYNDLLTEFNTAKKDTGYLSMRNLIIAQTTLEATKISVASWDNSVKLLKVIGMPDSEMENFHQFMLEKKDKNWNYRQLVVAYRMKQMDAPKGKN